MATAPVVSGEGKTWTGCVNSRQGLWRGRHRRLCAAEKRGGGWKLHGVGEVLGVDSLRYREIRRLQSTRQEEGRNRRPGGRARAHWFDGRGSN
jgi:hypothetical protein